MGRRGAAAKTVLAATSQPLGNLSRAAEATRDLQRIAGRFLRPGKDVRLREESPYHRQQGRAQDLGEARNHPEKRELLPRPK